jgi:hypothetical protein
LEPVNRIFVLWKMDRGNPDIAFIVDDHAFPEAMGLVEGS